MRTASELSDGWIDWGNAQQSIFPSDGKFTYATDVGVTSDPCPDAVNEDNGCIYLGTLSDLTVGPFAAAGPLIIDGQEAFWQRVNEDGGIGGYDINVTEYVRDNLYNPQTHKQVYGEIEGEVHAKVWLSPKYAMTVREYYRQRVKADVGDYNADPADGGSLPGTIQQLLEHPRVLRYATPRSEGALAAAAANAANTSHRSAPAHDTAQFGPRNGNFRVDYVLPSVGLPVQASGVFCVRASAVRVTSWACSGSSPKSRPDRLGATYAATPSIISTASPDANTSAR